MSGQLSADFLLLSYGTFMVDKSLNPLGATLDIDMSFTGARVPAVCVVLALVFSITTMTRISVFQTPVVVWEVVKNTSFPWAACPRLCRVRPLQGEALRP